MQVQWIKCTKCGNEVAYTVHEATTEGRVALLVEPCKSCLKSSYNAGYSEGWDEGDYDYDDSWVDDEDDDEDYY